MTIEFVSIGAGKSYMKRGAKYLDSCFRRNDSTDITFSYSEVRRRLRGQSI